MKTIIMAGGKGTRISSLFPGIPKPLIPIKNSAGITKPVLEWELLSLRKQGFSDIILTVSYMHEKIQSYFGDGCKFGINLSYYIEETPLGNAGALFKMRKSIGNESFLLLNADVIFDIDFNRFVRFHESKGGLITLFTHPNSHPYDSGLIFLDNSDNSVRKWMTKEDARPSFYKNRVNAGLHVINPEVLDMVVQWTGLNPDNIGKENPVTGSTITVDLDRQILKPLCGTHKMFAYDSPEYVKDMGTPERYEAVRKDFESGIVNEKNLMHPQKAIFLDRDGTINRYVGFLRTPSEFELCDGVAEAIKLINASGYLAIVITNQPVIARGEVTFDGLNEIHNKMETELGKQGAYIDGIYYCPHHPDKGFDGEIPELKINCGCRKPKPGLIIQAATDFNIDLNKSWIIGDGKSDIGAGKNAGCSTVLIKSTDTEEAEFGQDLTVDSLLEAVKMILSH